MPEWLILTFKIVMGPLVGAIIGFCTNWLAVKMLFHPYNELKLWKIHIPFTPGIIPKRRKAMARALGKAVGTALVTPTDIQRLFVSDEIKIKVGDAVANAVLNIDENTTAESVMRRHGDVYDKFLGRASEIVAEKLTECMRNALPSLLSDRFSEILGSRGGIGGLLGFFGGKFLRKLPESVSEKLDVFLEQKGYETLLPVVKAELGKISATPIRDFTEKAELTHDKISAFAGDVYEKYVVGKIVSFVAEFDIAGVVERKINEMDMEEVERLFMSVMKRELRAIVNLGGVLGAVVGIVNSLIVLLL